MGPKPKRKNTGKAKTIASLQAQVAATSGSTSSTNLAKSDAPVSGSTSSTPSGASTPTSSTSFPSSTINHASVPVSSNTPLTHEQKQADNGVDQQQAQEERVVSQTRALPRSPQRTPTIPVLVGTPNAQGTPAVEDDAEEATEQTSLLKAQNQGPHSHHDHGPGHVHAPQSTVDSQSIIHTLPTSSTPLKQASALSSSSTQIKSYGTTASSSSAAVDNHSHHDHDHHHPEPFQHGPHDPNSPPLRPLTPPPIACRGVLITSESTKNKRKLIFVTILCLVFFTIEMIGGYFAKSLALMSDAFHLLSDVVSFIVSLIAIWLSEQPATKRHSFGYHRAEVLAALISVFIIWILTGVLLMEAYERIQNPQPIDGKTMCVVASIGVAINIILAFALGHDHDHGGHGHGHDHGHDHNHGHDHSHNHGHDHSHDHSNGSASHSHNPDHTHAHDGKRDNSDNKALAAQKKETNLNVKAATLHVIGDLISSVGVLIASIVIMVKPSWTIVDPICTVFFSILVLFTTYRLVWDSLGILMEGTPTHIDPEEIEKSLLEIPGVTLVHDLHVWNLTAGKPSMAVHLQIAAMDLTMSDYDRILTEAQNVVCGRFQIHHSTIQLETASNSSEHCRPEMCQSEQQQVVRGYNAV